MPRPRSWTDDDLRAAVAASSTYKEVQRRLGLRSGSSHVAIRVRIAELGLDDEHLRMETRRKRAAQARARRQRATSEEPATRDARTWTDDDLRAAVAAATSLNGVFTALGLAVGGSQWLTMQDHIRRLDLDTSHWSHELPVRRSRGLQPRWTDEQLRAAVVASRSYAQVYRELDVRGGGSRAVVRRRIDELGLDVAHFTGQGWSRGMTNPAGTTPRPLDELLVRDSDYLHTSNLRDRLFEEGVKVRACEGCGLTSWNDRPAPLQLDHVNGDRRDNRLENLRILCPNCHALTETYCGRNRGRYASEESGDR